MCFQHLQRTGKFFSAFDLHAYTKGASKAGLDLHSQSIQAINEELVLRRKQFKKAKLRWRVSGGSRKSLGWIPFKVSGISYQNGQIKYAGQFFGLWDSYGLAKYTFKTGCFTQDARGRWYICVAELKEPVVKVKNENTEAIGIDLD